MSEGTGEPTRDAPRTPSTRSTASTPPGQQPRHGRGRIVVGIDLSEDSVAVLRQAHGMAQLLGADLEAISVYPSPTVYGWHWPPGGARTDVHTRVQHDLDAVAEEAFAGSRPGHVTTCAVEGDPAHTLLARSRAATMLVVGHGSRSAVANLVTGSTAAKCIEHAVCPVLVVHEKGRHGLRENHDRSGIVVGVDGSRTSKTALAWALRLAATSSAPVDVVLAWEQPTLFGVERGYLPAGWGPRMDFTEYLSGCVDEVIEGGERPATIRLIVDEASPTHSLLTRADSASLLVVGNRGHGGFANLMLGSVGARCAARASCSVLVVKVPPATEPEDEAAEERDRTRAPAAAV